MNITDFLVLNSEGEEIMADPHGNHMAFNCENCDYPILISALENQRGSDEEHPAECKGCGEKYFIDVRQRAEKMHLFNIKDML